MSCTFVYGCLSWWNESGNLGSLSHRAANLSHASFMVEIYLDAMVNHLWYTLQEKAIPMVNKKGVEVVHFVCLSCHFDMGLFHILGQEVLFMMLLLLAMTFNLNLLCFPSWVTHCVGTCIQGAWDIQPLLCQAYYSYLISL